MTALEEIKQWIVKVQAWVDKNPEKAAWILTEWIHHSDQFPSPPTTGSR